MMSLLAILTVVLCAWTLSHAAPEYPSRLAMDNLDIKGLIEKNNSPKATGKFISIIHEPLNKNIRACSFIFILTHVCKL